MSKVIRIFSILAVITVSFGSLTLASPASATSPMTLKFDTTLSQGEAAISVFSVDGIDPNFTLNWGDGSQVETITEAGVYTKDDITPGEFTVTLTGTVPGFGFYDFDWDYDVGFGVGIDGLTEVVSFGDVGLKSLRGAFDGAGNLANVPNVLPSTATDLSGAFNGASIFNDDIGSWNVGNVTDMSHLFDNAELFNKNIGSWNVGNVTRMDNMFEGADAFNQNIGSWNVSSVTNMDDMFENNDSFNQNIGGWNVSNVTTMDNMFENTIAFNQNIGGWNTSNVLDMADMFKGSVAFNQDIGNWDVSRVTDMNDMFEDSLAFDQDIGGWDIRRVTNMNDMLSGSSMSRLNYDRTLIGWSQLDWSADFSVERELDADGLEYCAESAWDSLTDEDNGFFRINDAGLSDVCPPLILSSSNVANGAVNPSITITGSSFSSGIGISDFTIDFGSTGLTLASVQYISATEVRLVFAGTARVGTMSITADTSAYDPAPVLASDPLEMEVPSGQELAATGPTSSTGLLALTSMFLALGLALRSLGRRPKIN